MKIEGIRHEHRVTMSTTGGTHAGDDVVTVAHLQQFIDEARREGAKDGSAVAYDFSPRFQGGGDPRALVITWWDERPPVTGQDQGDRAAARDTDIIVTRPGTET